MTVIDFAQLTQEQCNTLVHHISACQESPDLMEAFDINRVRFIKAVVEDRGTLSDEVDVHM